MAAAKDYVYARLKELQPIILSERGARRQEAKDEREFLLEELAKVQRRGPGTVEVDPRLARAMRERGARGHTAPSRDTQRTVFPLKGGTGRTAAGAGTGKGGGPVAGPLDRPSYWAECEGMDFNGLRAFMDECLQTPGPDASKLPRRKQEFTDLLRLLADKGGIELDGDLRPVAVPNEDDPSLRKASAYRDGLSRKLAAAQRDLASRKGRRRRNAPERVRNLQQELARVGSEIARLEAEAKSAKEKPRTEKQRLRRLKATRTERVGRVRRDIERVFADGGPGGGQGTYQSTGRAVTGRLPWRILPPGELSLERVLAHYERLGRARPDVRYEPERLAKAWSLDPDGCYVGDGEFDGYVVFTFRRTNRALLERPVYGNAIYVLGSDWKRLCRLSKHKLLADHTLGVTKIVHKGDWFARTKAALGVR